MSSIDDLPIDPARGDSAPPEPPPHASSPWKMPLIVGLVVALTAGAWFAITRGRPATTAAPAVGAATQETRAGADRTPAPATLLPPLEQMDPVVRQLVTTLSAHPLLLKWLATDDLVGSIATAIDRLSRGQSPARDLAVLRPAAAFGVVKRGGGLLVDPASHTRYDGLVDAATSMDSAQLAAVFVTLTPRLADAFARQGHPDGGFDAAVRRALEVVAATPDVGSDAVLVSGVGGYMYADPNLERLLPAQKQLVRMGPANVRRVREAASRFAAALSAGVPPTR